MSTLKELFKDLGFKIAIKTFIFMFLASLVMIILSYNFFIEFSSFSVGMMKFTIAVSVFWFFDRVAVREVDTIQLLENNPVAYSIFLLGIAIIAAACISTS